MIDKHQLREKMQQYIANQDNTCRQDWLVTDQRMARSVLAPFLRDVFGLELDEKVEYEDFST